MVGKIFDPNILLHKGTILGPIKIGYVDAALSGVYTSNLLNDLDFYLDEILTLYEAKYLGQIFSQTFCFIEGQFLAQIKFQIV